MERLVAGGGVGAAGGVASERPIAVGGVAATATIKMPSKSPEVMVVSVPMVPTASWPKAAKKSWATGP